MACGDHFVIDEFFLCPEVARQAFLRAPSEVSRVIHPGGNRLLVSPVARRVRAKPCRSRPVAAFATDAFAQVESSGAHLGRHVKRVAGETLRRLLGLADAQDAPHPLAGRTGERVIRFRMLVLHGPDAVFVLKYAAIGARLHAAVATGGTAGAGPRVFAGFSGRIRGAHRTQRGKKNRAEANYGASQRQSLGLRPDTHSCARMEPCLIRASRGAGPCQKFLYCPLEVKSTEGNGPISWYRTPLRAVVNSAAPSITLHCERPSGKDSQSGDLRSAVLPESPRRLKRRTHPALPIAESMHPRKKIRGGGGDRLRRECPAPRG